MDNDIGWAVEQMRRGNRVRRDAWPTALAVYLVQGSTFEVNRAPLNEHYPLGTKIDYEPHVDFAWMSRTCGVYTFTMADVLALDWARA